MQCDGFEHHDVVLGKYHQKQNLAYGLLWTRPSMSYLKPTIKVNEGSTRIRIYQLLCTL